MGILASAIRALGFKNVAGDARDKFHMTVMTDKEMSKLFQCWRIAWKGKVEAAINYEAQDHPDEQPALIVVDGGPECAWEQGELQNTILPAHADLKPEFVQYGTWQNALLAMTGVDIHGEEERAVTHIKFAIHELVHSSSATWASSFEAFKAESDEEV